ncbi:Dolichyl-phosphate-mannose-protein mannosyltransferase [Clostridium collagenovorans DSM 3089]|uniref:Dolichyl-phosphate-mannose-protein mannosyltransferase n=1 Tax=Clostridium collagenovorans DSM 3089 TaxID=1121306 RepID=A0A1M5VHD6_9CLOT|nr:glycosyltransferase family 39 protein [Clostridium collagenovorans]SHH74669.1 Dolichyl-phosphate-mannose-protein mannosyltransferase [Clostridium collagenovorans DSM 3089]
MSKKTDENRVNIYEGIISLIERYSLIISLIILLVITYICFKNLGVFPVQDWDEARHGVSAYEMLKNNEYIINTYNYTQDYWNLKPPLSFWAIIASFKIFGTSVFSMRFYSAISMIITSIISARFIYKKYGKLESIISLISFSACLPLYMNHMGRHGDADSLFLLLFTIAMLCMMSIKENKRNLYFCGLAFALAFLTKSWHAFSIVAIGGLYLLFTCEIKKISLKQWVIFASSFIMPIAIWIALRIGKDGFKFLIEMVRYDLLARSNIALEGHTGDVWTYLEFIFSESRMLVILMCSIILLGIGYYSDKIMLRKNHLIGFGLWIIVPFAIFTKASTKLGWYIIPLYIPMIIVSSIIFGRLLKDKKVIKSIKIIVFVTLIATQLVYIKDIVNFVNTPSSDSVQKFIEKSAYYVEEVKGKRAYIDISGDEWSQSRLFLAEIIGDFKCENGGVGGFIKNKESAVLIAKKELYYDNQKFMMDTRVLFEDDEYVFVTK